MNKLHRSLASFVLCAALCTPVHAAEKITLWSSTSALQNIFSKIKTPFEKSTGITIVYAGDSKNTTALTYVEGVLSGAADAATSSLPWAELTDLAAKGGIKGDAMKQITYRLVGHDLMTVFANKGIGITELSLEQIAGLFAGKTKNWKEIGGADLPVKIIFLSQKPATSRAFEKLAMGGASIAGNQIVVKTYEESLTVAAKTPGTIGYGPRESRSDAVLVVKTPTIGRPINLLTKGRPSANIQKLIDFIRTEGKKHGVEN